MNPNPFSDFDTFLHDLGLDSYCGNNSHPSQVDHPGSVPEASHSWDPHISNPDRSIDTPKMEDLGGFHQMPQTLHSDPQSGSTSTANSDSEFWQPHHHFQAQNFHSTHPETIVLGNPAEEMSHWHLQQAPDSCGISAQQSAIESLNHQHLSETTLRHEAEVHGWYAPHIGTTAEDFGKLIEQHTGVSVQHHYGGTIAEIENHLAHGEKVFVGVSSAVEWLPDQHSALGQAAPNLFDPSHYTGKPADHIVQVVGIEVNLSDPHQSNVIVNDSGTPDGRGVEIPIDQFQQAMDASHGFVASSVSHPVNDPFASIVHHVTPSENSDNLTFGCKVNWHDNVHSITIGDQYGALYYRGDTFYWDSHRENVAGTWSCDTHQAYSKNGVNLGYAANKSDAALLIYRQNN